MGFVARLMGRPKFVTPLGRRASVRDHVVSEGGNVQYLTPLAVLVKPGGTLTLFVRYDTIIAVTATDAAGTRRRASRKATVEEGTPLDFEVGPDEPRALLIEQLDPGNPLARKTPI